MPGLYQVENPFTKVLQGVRGASQSLARMGQERSQKTETEPAAGQDAMSVGGLGLTGYQVYSGMGPKTTPTAGINPALLPGGQSAASIPVTSGGIMAAKGLAPVGSTAAPVATSAVGGGIGAAAPVATALPTMSSGAVGSTTAVAAAVPAASTTLAATAVPAATGVAAGAGAGAATGTAIAPGWGTVFGVAAGVFGSLFASR